MIILKKIAGYFLIVFAILMAIGLLGSTFQAILQSSKEIHDNGLAEGLGYAFGSLFMIIIFILLVIYCMKTGLKLLKNKTKITDSIEDIGKEF
ncbi:hypothetical protein GKZ90_0015500 [Flavobacterium sp. MC2016-06]|uniref:hypothetical protein n=1 Tax=Flavobacterium sp. MC2016-06 TaxID=2676308 RepID=UPI0012BAF86D|nr:hypothetical protein [Flavobacterium sp. MC2016-06]MBU3860557.1 hypothetical protein [Flavobacterium sp. MC2016-06]